MKIFNFSVIAVFGIVDYVQVVLDIRRDWFEKNRGHIIKRHFKVKMTDIEGVMVFKIQNIRRQLKSQGVQIDQRISKID